MANPFDESSIRWDDAPSTAGAANSGGIRWDDQPSQPAAPRRGLLGMAMDAGYTAINPMGAIKDRLQNSDDPASQGARSAYGRTSAFAAQMLSAPAVLWDNAASAVSDQPTTTAQDFVFKNYVDPGFDLAARNQLPANAGFLQSLAHGIGGVGVDLPAMMLTGGASAGAEVGMMAPRVGTGLAELVGGALEHSAKASLVPATRNASGTASDVLARGGSGIDATKAAAGSAAADVLLNSVPVGVQGGPVTRLASGFASGVAGAPVAQSIRNATLPDDMRHDVTWDDALIAGTQNAVMAGTMGQRAEPGPVARLAQVRDVDSRRAQVKDIMDRAAQPGDDVGATPDADAAQPSALDTAAAEAATHPGNDLPEPTEAQREAGNYRKGHVRLNGLDVSIENPRGSTRSGTDADGNAWSVEMQHHYGYIRGSESADGEHVDVFMGPEAESPDAPVFVVDQVDPKTGKFDEHKVMLGFPDADAAEQGYRANYANDWNGLRTITPTTIDGLKDWLANGKPQKPFAESPQGKESTRVAAMQDAADAPRRTELRDAQQELASHEQRAKDLQAEIDGLSDRRATTLAEMERQDAESVGAPLAASKAYRRIREKTADQDLRDRRAALESEAADVAGRIERQRHEVTRMSSAADALTGLRRIERGESATTQGEVDESAGPAAEQPSIAGDDVTAATTSTTGQDRGTGRGSDGDGADGRRLEPHDAESLRQALRASSLGPAFDALHRAGALDIVHEPDSPSAGTWNGRRAVLNAAKIPRGEELGVALHELGVHGGREKQGGLRALAGDAEFTSLGKRLDEIAADGGADAELVRAADARAERAKPEDRAEERLAYFVEEATRRQQAGTLKGNSRMLLTRIVARMKAWLYRSRVQPLLERAGVKLSPDDFVALAKAAVRARARSGDTATAEKSSVLESRPRPTVHGDNDLAAGLGLLGTHDEAFQLRTSEEKSLEGVFKEIEPRYGVHEAPEIAEQALEPAETAWRVATPEGRKATVYQDRNAVWIDVSDLQKGEDGKRIYNAVANWAHNTGKVFVGDPAGLSNVALKRRTENMLSSALKFGTTDHVYPHERQLRGDKASGVPPIDWRVGEHGHNIEAMAKASHAFTAREFPEIADLSYNPDTARFERPDGTEFTDDDFDKLASDRRIDDDLRAALGSGSEATAAGSDAADGVFQGKLTAGSTSLKRAVLAGSLVRGSRESRSRLLAQLGSERTPGSLSKILYSYPRNVTAEQADALAKTGAYVKKEPLAKRLAKLTADWRARAEQGLLDQFAPLAKLDPQAFMQAHLSKGTDGALEATFLHGTPKLTDGALDIDPDSKGFRGVLSDLDGEHDLFLAWVAGHRADTLSKEWTVKYDDGTEQRFPTEQAARTAAQGLRGVKVEAASRERLFTPTDIAALKKLDQGAMSNGRSRAVEYGKAQQALKRYQKSVLDVAEAAGLIDGGSRAQWESEFYVPFYRVLDEDQGATYSAGNVGGLVRQKAIQKLRGGKEKLGDLLGNTLSNWSQLLSSSMKNMAATKAIDAAVQAGIAQRVSGAEKGSVWIMRNGKQEHYTVDDPRIIEALSSLHFGGYDNFAMKAMSTFKHVLTTGVTIAPAFRIRNLLRDSLHSVAVADLSYNPLRNLVDGWKGTAHGSATNTRMLAGGGAVRFGSLNDGAQAANAKRLIKMGIKDKSILDTSDKFKNAFSSAWNWWKEVGDRSETINRAALYQKLRKEGKNHLEASYAARDLLNFTSMGSWTAVRALNQVLPFLNARAQGQYKLYRGARGNPQRFAAVAGTIAMASALTYLLQKDDPDYKALPDWARDSYWCVKLGDKMVYIPKPFEIGALGSVVERGTELAFGGKDYKAGDFGKGIASLLVSQLSMNPIPQLFRPAAEAYANYDTFRGSEIDSKSDQKLLASDRYDANTSAGAIVLARATGEDGVSPKRIEHMVKGYLGWIGIQALTISDILGRAATDMPTSPRMDFTKVDNLPVIGDFVKDAKGGSSKYVQRFYDAQDEINKIYATSRHDAQAGDTEGAKELATRPTQRLRPVYENAAQQLQLINAAIKQTRDDPKLSAADKSAKLEDLAAKRNTLAKQVDEAARKLQ